MERNHGQTKVVGICRYNLKKSILIRAPDKKHKLTSINIACTISSPNPMFSHLFNCLDKTILTSGQTLEFGEEISIIEYRYKNMFLPGALVKPTKNNLPYYPKVFEGF